MQTNDNSQENRNSKRTLICIGLAAVAVAGALGAAFMLGGRTGGSVESSVDGQAAVSPTAAAEGSVEGSTVNPDGQSNQAQGSDNDLPGPTETPASADQGEEETPTDTPTATSTPSGECAFCLDGDLAAEPTPTSTPDPCPLCNDLDLVAPVDTPPTISNISTSFCYPTMAVFFDVEDADSVWFTFVHNGVTHHSDHIDADTFLGFLTKDMAYLDWGVYLIHSLKVWAKDDQGNQVWTDDIPVPEPDLTC